MDRDTIISGLGENILSYVMQGRVAASSVTDVIKPAELDSRFEKLDMLLDLHFLLRPETIQFVEALPGRLRNIRTETQNVSRTTRGAIDGRIDWSGTIKKRHSQFPNDRSIFVVENRSENYDISANIVLKRLLAVIYETLEAADTFLDADYTWVEQSWAGEQSLRDRFTDIFEKNVHIDRIRSPEAYEPTERMIARAKTARQPIYREAAQLLERRSKIQRGDEAALQDLLEETAILPDDDDKLFELYVLFRVINALDNAYGDRLTLKPIRAGRDAVAVLEGDEMTVQVYHDQAAVDEGYSFVPVPDSPPTSPSRLEAVHLTSHDVAESYFDTGFDNQTGRPDVFVLEATDADDQTRRLVVEVKNSTTVKTIRTGIKETLEYLAFMRHEDDFVHQFTEQGYFGSGWEGLLVTQDTQRETPPVTTQQSLPISIVEASDLSDALPVVIHRQLFDTTSSAIYR